MTTQESLLQTGVDRFRAAVSTLEDEVQNARHQLSRRRKALEKAIDAQRRNVRKEASKQLSALKKTPLVKRADALRQTATERLSALQDNDLVKRADALRQTATEQIESGVDSVLGVFQIASKSDLQRIDRKLSQLSKKLKEIERGKVNGSTH